MAVGALSLLGWCAPALAQEDNPVYVDDSALAGEALVRLEEHRATGNLSEAVRVIQRLLDDEGDRVVGAVGDEDLFVSVRARAHDALRADDALLERYRLLEGPVGERMLAEGDEAEVARTRLMTSAGLEAALRQARRHLEAARFETGLRVIAELEGHPDLTGAARTRAAALAGELASYVDRDGTWAMVERLGGKRGDVRVWPEPAKRLSRSVVEPGPALDLESIVGRPLWSETVGDPASLAEVRAPVRGRGGIAAPEHGVELAVFPAIAGDTVYANDGNIVTAWDRFTAMQRWRFDVRTDRRVGRPVGVVAPSSRRVYADYDAGRLEEPLTVGVSGQTVVATMGRASQGSRTGDARTFALDVLTGEPRWGVNVEGSRGLLPGASVRGAPLIGEGVVVLGAVKFVPQRRLRSMHLIGLDEWTGEVRWTRQVGSAGALPYRVQAGAAHGGVLRRGVVYRSDSLGVVGAYEAWTGRPVWVRRMPAPAFRPNTLGGAWLVNVPLIDGDSLVMLTPDRNDVVRLDIDTGEELGRRSRGRFLSAEAQYLATNGTTLAVVGAAQVGLSPMAFEEAGPRVQSSPIGDLGIRGRVVGSGDVFLVPLSSGIAVLDPSAPAEYRQLELEHAGNALAVQTQLVVADDARVHGYLLWEMTEAILTERMESAPEDPAPALTFAELAYRAGRFERILWATDRAIAALEDEEGDGALRRRLFDSLARMVAVSQSEAFGRAPAESPAPVIRDTALLSELVERLGSLARSADDRVSYLLARGRLWEDAGDPGEAVASYQRVLEDGALTGARWTGSRLTVRADIEATRRLARVISREGVGVYAPVSRRASQELRGLGDAPSVEELESIAQRFPLAGAATRAWLMIAAGVDDAGWAPERLRALEHAHASSLLTPGAGGALAGESVERLVEVLLDEGEPEVASRAVFSSIEAFGRDLPLGEGGRTLGMLEREVAEALRSARRRPSVGALANRTPQVLQDLYLLEPLLRDRRGERRRALVLANDAEVAAFVVGPGEPGAEGDLIEKVWSRELNDESIQLVEQRGDELVLFSSSPDGARLEKVSLSLGEVMWRTGLFSSYFPGGPKAGAVDVMREELSTPLDGVVLSTDVLIASDGRTYAVIERTGRTAAFDAGTGRRLWAERAPVERVMAADLTSGTLVIGGERDLPMDRAGLVGSSDVVAVMDARTGAVTQELGPDRGRVRWVRAVGSGTVLVGLQRALLSVDVERGEENWVLGDASAMASRDVWVFGDSFLLLGKDRLVRLGDLVGGRLLRDGAPLENRYDRLVAPIDVHSYGDDLFAVTSAFGVVLYSGEGEVVGADALSNVDGVVTPSPAEGVLVTVDATSSSSAAIRSPDGREVFGVHRIEANTGRVLSSDPIALWGRPRRTAVLDGVVAVTAGSSTTIFWAPAGD